MNIDEKRRKTQSFDFDGRLRPTPIITDPQGCYTGRPLELNEQPVQDADDL
jgi:hypothetical protein